MKTELNFTSARLSFFNHFPALTLTLYDFTLKGSAPFEKDTLVASKEIALGIDLSSLIAGKIYVDKIFLTKAFINVQANEKGEANYNVYASSDSATKNDSDTSSNASLKIEKIIIEKSHITYNDRSFPMLINAKGFNYVGKGATGAGVRLLIEFVLSYKK